MRGPLTTFEAGDKVMHPYHGGGLVEEIVDKEIGDQTQQYYVIANIIDGMKHFVPVDKVDQIGLAKIDDAGALKDCLEGFTITKEGLPSNIGKLKDEVKVMIDSGRLEEIAEAIQLIHSYKLEALEGRSHLNYSVSSLLKRAERMFSSHMALIQGIDFEQAYQDLLQHLDKIYAEDIVAA